MIRRIYCLECGKLAPPLEPEDVAMGWKLRFREITAYKPAEHTLGIDGQEFKLQGLVCDQCNVKIPDGSKAVAMTQWRGKEPEDWEAEYENPTRL